MRASKSALFPSVSIPNSVARAWSSGFFFDLRVLDMILYYPGVYVFPLFLDVGREDLGRMVEEEGRSLSYLVCIGRM